VPQSLPITRTELTRRCCCAPIEPEADAEPAEPAAPAEPDVEPLVVPEVEPVVDPVVPLPEPLPDIEPEPLARVPVTSTRLPTSDVRSDELPSRT